MPLESRCSSRSRPSPSRCKWWRRNHCPQCALPSHRSSLLRSRSLRWPRRHARPELPGAPSTAPVHLGETFGVTPNPNATRAATVAAIGNPYGGMQGPAVAPHGVVGSTGIGNGTHFGSNAGTVGRVASAGIARSISTGTYDPGTLQPAFLRPPPHRWCASSGSKCNPRPSKSSPSQRSDIPVKLGRCVWRAT